MQFRDLKSQYQVLKSDIDQAIQNVLNESSFIMGRQVSALEQDLAIYTGVRYCIACANGTDALSLALMAWGIKAGDAVFVPDFTFFATGEVVSLIGATPVFVDVDAVTFNMDPIKLEAAIKDVLAEGKYRPRAVIPVDLFGLPADYQEISKIAKKYDLYILEDGAQGFGGSVDTRRACSFGHVSTTSFFPAKPLGCYGDGGAVFTDDDELAEKMRSIRIHGKGSDRYDNVRIGLNSRLDTLQAAILQVKLKAFADYELDKVNKVAQIYTTKLNGVVKAPFIPPGYYSSWAQYTIQLKNREQRDKLQAGLKSKGIPSMIYYPKPMHNQTAFAGLEVYGMGCETTDRLSETVLSLPIHPYLREEDQDFIISSVLEIVGTED